MKKINVNREVNWHFENKRVSRLYFFFIFMMYALVYMTKNCFNGALADIKASNIMSASEAGLIVAMFYIAYTPLQIVGGIVADKVSPECLIKIGIGGAAIANAVIFFNHNYYVMLVTWTLNAMVQFALWPSVYKIVSSQLCRSDRGFMIFLISMASSVGLLISYLVAAVLPSWEYNFLISALVLIALVIGMHIYDSYVSCYAIKDSPQEERGNLEIKRDVSTASLLWRSGFFILLLTVLVRAVVSQGVQTLSPLMLVETFSAEPWLSNLLNTLIIICGIVGSLLVKFVLYPRVIKNEAVGILIIMAIFLALGSMLLLTSSNMSATVVNLCLMSVIATVPTILTSYFNAGFAKYGKNGTAAGISNSAASLGFVVSSYGITSIAESAGWGAVRLTWIGMLAVSVATMIPVVFMYVSFKRREESN